MARSAPDPPSNSTRRFPLTVRLGGEDFTYDLCGRRLALGPKRSVDYY